MLHSPRKIHRDLPSRSALHASVGTNSMLDEPRSSQRRTHTSKRFRECQSVRFVDSCRALLAASLLMLLASPAAAGMEDSVKALKACDLATADKDLMFLVKERGPRAEFFAWLYLYGNPQ